MLLLSTCFPNNFPSELGGGLHFVNTGMLSWLSDSTEYLTPPASKLRNKPSPHEKRKRGGGGDPFLPPPPLHLGWSLLLPSIMLRRRWVHLHLFCGGGPPPFPPLPPPPPSRSEHLGEKDDHTQTICTGHPTIINADAWWINTPS